MCLEIKSSSRKQTAKRDIVVYKIVKMDLCNSFVTPYEYFPVSLGKTYASELVRKGDSIEMGIHSLKDEDGVKREMKWFEDFSSTYKVIKCIIPKDSKYYVGKFDGCNSIASNSIKYIEFIEH